MSLMNDFQLLFHSYLTICTRIELHLERMLCIDLDRPSTAPYSKIKSTMYDLSIVRCS